MVDFDPAAAPPHLPALVDLDALGARAGDLARRSHAVNSERAYRSDWADFVWWCEAAGRCALPADSITVGAYLTDRSGILKVATLNRRIAAIMAAAQALPHRVSMDPLDATDQGRADFKSRPAI
jgi:hypothetical protein